MEDGVVVLLEIRHPRDGVNERQERFDPFPMAADHRVHVWQVEDGHRAEVLGSVFAHLRYAKPFEKRTEGLAIGVRHPGHGLGRRGSPD